MSARWIAVTASIAAMFCFNFFFLPPVGTLMIADSDIEAARAQVAHVTSAHAIRSQATPDAVVRLDPRLTATALAHVLENAAQYAPPRTTISLDASVAAGALTTKALVLRVRIFRESSIGFIAALLLPIACRAPAWDSRSRLDCWRRSTQRSKRQTGPAAARGSP